MGPLHIHENPNEEILMGFDGSHARGGNEVREEGHTLSCLQGQSR